MAYYIKRLGWYITLPGKPDVTYHISLYIKLLASAAWACYQFSKIRVYNLYPHT